MSQALRTLPTEFVERLWRIVPPRYQPGVLRALERRRPTTFRANTLKTTPSVLQRALAERGLKATPVHWWPAAFVLRTGSLRDLEATDLYQEGHLYVQSLASMLPPLVLDPQPGERILDLAAAPGSKTTQMAAMMGNTGEIVANDSHPIRLQLLSANLARQGVTNTRLSQQRGETLWRLYPNTFDRVLVDAPCSGEGRLSAADRHLPAINRSDLVRRQRQLLRSAVLAARPGGTIVYATCTLAPEENEGVVDWLLQTMGDVVEILPIQLEGVPLTPGLTEWDGTTYDPRLQQTARLYPTDLYEGFYLAKLRKVRPTAPPTDSSS